MMHLADYEAQTSSCLGAAAAAVANVELEQLQLLWSFRAQSTAQ